MAAGLPSVERYKATLRLRKGFYGAHKLSVTNDMILTDVVWSSIASQIEALGHLEPDPAAVELQWEVIATGEPEGRGKRHDCEVKRAAGRSSQNLCILVIEDKWFIAIGLRRN